MNKYGHVDRQETIFFLNQGKYTPLPPPLSTPKINEEKQNKTNNNPNKQKNILYLHLLTPHLDCWVSYLEQANVHLFAQVRRYTTALHHDWRIVGSVTFRANEKTGCPWDKMDGYLFITIVVVKLNEHSAKYW